jgi:sporulation protein YlmC with PRC-barrel domain
MTGSITASHLIGADVRNMKNEDLGEVDDVVITSGNNKASYVLVSHGGFLGIGDEQIAVPLSAIKVTPEGETVVVLDMSEEQFEDAPSFDRDSNEAFENADWRMKNDKYFSDHRS